MIVKLSTDQHLEFLSLKGSCRGSSKSTHVKMPHCWKSHALAQIIKLVYSTWMTRKVLFSFCWIIPISMGCTITWYIGWKWLKSKSGVAVSHHGGFSLKHYRGQHCQIQLVETAKLTWHLFFETPKTCLIVLVPLMRCLCKNARHHFSPITVNPFVTTVFVPSYLWRSRKFAVMRKSRPVPGFRIIIIW